MAAVRRPDLRDSAAPVRPTGANAPSSTTVNSQRIAGRYGSALFPQHAEKLASSAVSPEVARERGTRSADTKAQLARLGFKPAQQRVPGLVIPLHDMTGEVVGHQYRPDEPRWNDGRCIKYDTPRGQSMVLDVPPRAREHLGNPAVPLFVTEGPIKADAAVSAGVYCVALLGVWGWRGTNDEGGRVALAAWESIALNGRRVVIAFDSDALLNSSVQQGMGRLGAFLAHRGADVGYLYLEAGPKGEKIGLDDWLAQGHNPTELWQMVRADLLPPPGTNGLKPAPEPDVPLRPTADLLAEVMAVLRGYVVFPLEAQAVAVALWVLLTYVYDGFDTCPYLDVSSPTKQAGKSRLFDVLALLCARAWVAVSVTEAVLFRKIASDQPTLLLDEMDATFGKDQTLIQGIRGVLDAGYRRGATVPRCVGPNNELVDFACFGPKAFAGIGEKLPDTVADRCVPIRLRRRAPSEPKPERFRQKIARAELAPLAAELRAWGKAHGKELAEAEPTLPDVLSDRQQDCWEPLLAIAGHAEGDWGAMARRAAVELHGGVEDDGDLGVTLLFHVRDAFHEVSTDGRLSTEALLHHLVGRGDESPWARWWADDVDNRRTKGPASRLARLLKPYGIEPTQVRIEGEKTRGYLREAFEDAWERYASLCPVFGPGNDGTTVPPTSEGTSGSEPETTKTRSEQVRTDVPSRSQENTGQEKAAAPDGPGAGPWRGVV